MHHTKINQQAVVVCQNTSHKKRLYFVSLFGTFKIALRGGKMKIQKVTVGHHDRGIGLVGWESVIHTLNCYASGRSRGSHATQNEQIKAVGQSFGALGLGLYLNSAQHMQGTSTFVENMLSEAYLALQSRNHWSRHYDYDGQGVFFKTTVEITVLDRMADQYMLEICAAYVGSEPEAGLADGLGITRALRHFTVISEVEPADEHNFAFDFDQYLRTLDGVLQINLITGEFIVSQLATTGRYSSTKPAMISCEADIKVTVVPENVASRFDYGPEGVAVDTWIADGPVLTGPLETSYEDRSKKETPHIRLTISSANVDSLGYSQPIFDCALRERIAILANKIAKSLEG